MWHFFARLNFFFIFWGCPKMYWGQTKLYFIWRSNFFNSMGSQFFVGGPNYLISGVQISLFWGPIFYLIWGSKFLGSDFLLRSNFFLNLGNSFLGVQSLSLIIPKDQTWLKPWFFEWIMYHSHEQESPPSSVHDHLMFTNTIISNWNLSCWKNKPNVPNINKI